MDLSLIPITELLPQLPPFVLVDRLIMTDDTCTITEFDVKDTHICYDYDCMLSEYALIENVAQTAAVRLGYSVKYIDKESVKIGVIGAIKDFKVVRRPCKDETLTTSVKVVGEVFNMTLIEGEIRIQDELIASCSMKIALKD